MAPDHRPEPDDHAALDEEIQDAERSAALEEMAYREQWELDQARFEQEQAVMAALERQLADLERENP